MGRGAGQSHPRSVPIQWLADTVPDPKLSVAFMGEGRREAGVPQDRSRGSDASEWAVLVQGGEGPAPAFGGRGNDSTVSDGSLIGSRFHRFKRMRLRLFLFLIPHTFVFS